MIFVGSLISLQGSANSALGKYLEHPLHAAIVSFSSGLLVLCLVSLFMKIGFPSATKVLATPKSLLIGGFLGTIYVTSVIVCAPKVGVATVVLAALCGQIIFSLVLDHIGAFGMPQNPIDLPRVIGACLMILGLMVINHKKIMGLFS